MRHDGELAVQRRTGVLKDLGSARVGSAIPPVAEDFLADLPFVVIGAVKENAVWATILVGPPGFVSVPGDRSAAIDAVPGPPDPLHGHFVTEADIGVLALEPSTRRRIRLNGQARIVDNGLMVRTDQVYSNCPKYIQQRVLTSAAQPSRGERTDDGPALTAEHQQWLAGADTFYIATTAPGLGADVSHRGGNPGFVHVLGPRRLAWPDYVGNSMYMTLGNLELDPRAGLLLVDPERGDALHLTGRATVDWDPERAATMRGAQRVIDFEVDRVVRVAGASPLRWRDVEPSPFNP